jgi:hypothetical protein
MEAGCVTDVSEEHTVTVEVRSVVITSALLMKAVCFSEMLATLFLIMVPTPKSRKFRIVFWDVLPCKIIVDT